MTSTKIIVGNNIDFFRKQHNMSQADLYRKIGSNSASLNEWIRGKKMPEIESLEKLAAVFCVPISEFFVERIGVADDDKNIAALAYYRFLSNHPDAMNIVDDMMGFSNEELSSLRVMSKQIKKLRHTKEV